MKTLLQNDYRHILKIKSKCLYDKNGGEWIIDKGSGNPHWDFKAPAKFGEWSEWEDLDFSGYIIIH
jgi:hypothetical protein